MEVPGDVGVHGVDAEGAEPGEPVLPQVGVDTEVVQGPGDDAVGAAATPESVRVVGEVARGSVLVVGSCARGSVLVVREHARGSREGFEMLACGAGLCRIYERAAHAVNDRLNAFDRIDRFGSL